MLNVYTEGNLVCWSFVNVKLNGELNLLGQSQFEGLTIFRDVNQERVDTLLGTVAH